MVLRPRCAWPCRQVQLNADLLMLCTDVDGLFTGNPKDQASEFIPTYCPEVQRAPQQSAAPGLQHHVLRSSQSQAPSHTRAKRQRVAPSCDTPTHLTQPADLKLLARIPTAGAQGR
jgi:hypothetical protein